VLIPFYYATSSRAQSLRPIKVSSNKKLGGVSHFLFPLIQDMELLSSPFSRYSKQIKWKIAVTLHTCDKGNTKQYEAQFLINLILKDEIKEKIIKKKKKNQVNSG
jgi:hypothetical protein